MIKVVFVGGLVLASVALPLCAYVFIYAVLRCAGSLNVNREGWQAGTFSVLGHIAVTAARMLDAFEPLLRMESGLRRYIYRPRGQEDPVSEVVVEVIPMV